MCKCLVWVFWWWYIAKVEKWHEWPFKFGWIRLPVYRLQNSSYHFLCDKFCALNNTRWLFRKPLDDVVAALSFFSFFLFLFAFIALSLSRFQFWVVVLLTTGASTEHSSYQMKCEKSDRMPFVYSVLVSVTYLYRSKILRNSFIRIWIHVGRIYLVVCLFVCLCILHVLILDDNLTFNVYVSFLGTITVWPYMKQHFYSFSIGFPTCDAMQFNWMKWFNMYIVRIF